MRKYQSRKRFIFVDKEGPYFHWAGRKMRVKMSNLHFTPGTRVYIPPHYGFKGQDSICARVVSTDGAVAPSIVDFDYKGDVGAKQQGGTIIKRNTKITPGEMGREIAKAMHNLEQPSNIVVKESKDCAGCRTLRDSIVLLLTDMKKSIDTALQCIELEGDE